jgi:heptosyltransferase-1
MSEQIKKILIIKPSALGDIIQALPAACCLARSFPDARIDWFVRPEYAALIENHKCINKVVIFDRNKLGKWWYSPKACAELIKLVRQLRKEKYNLVFDFQGRFRSAIFAWFSACKERFGMAETQEIASPFYTHRIAQSTDSIHLVDYFLDMVCAAGAKRSKVEFGLEPQTQPVDETRKILTTNHANADNYAVFVPGATVEAKRWPIESFAALAEKVYEKYQYSIVAIGVESEKATAEKLQALTSVPVINLVRKTSIKQLVALLAGARIVVSNDTGPAHIAAALGVPMVLIFGYTNPSRVGPYGRNETVAAINADTRGSEVESTNPAHDIKNVTVESVFAIISRQLG